MCENTEKTDSSLNDSMESLAAGENVKEIFASLAKVLHIKGEIGSGTFSKVYLATASCTEGITKEFAIKHLIPTCHPSRIENEVRCLSELGGRCNIISMDLCIREKGHVAFVMPYLPTDKFQNFFRDMKVDEVRDYLRNLLIALKEVHMHNIIHRDIKPNNFLYQRKTRKYALVDFGLAQRLDTEWKSPVQRTFPKSGHKENDSPSKHTRAKETMRKRDSPAKRTRLAQTRILDHNTKPHCTMCPVDKEHKHHVTEPKQPTKQPPNKVIKLDQSRVNIFKKPVTADLFGSSRDKRPFFGKGDRILVCECFGRNRICQVCWGRGVQFAPRAGTSGFRPPEVLLKHPQQSTAVDMWAVGVLLLCILSGRFPFFRSSDDLSCLAEIVSVMGTREMETVAKKYNKLLLCSEKKKPLDLKKLCQALWSPPEKKKKQDGSPKKPACVSCLQITCLCKTNSSIEASTTSQRFPDSAFDLLYRLLDIDPEFRISAEEALKHPFICGE